MLLNAPEMLAVAEMYAGWVERLDFPRLDAFKATYEPPNSPPTQSSFFSDRQLFQITGPWGVQSLADYKPDMNYTVTHLPVPAAGAAPITWAGGVSLTVPTRASMSRADWECSNLSAGYDG